MSALTPDQFVAAHKATIESMLEMSSKTFDGIERMVDLHMQAARASLDEGAEHAKALLSVKDPQELMALQAGMLQPAAEKLTAFARQVYEIASGTQTEIAKVAEAQVADMQEKMVALVDTAVKNAPAGSENAAALMKSAVSAANNAFESVQKATKQAVTTAEANFQAMSQTAADAAKVSTQAAAKPRRAA